VQEGLDLETHADALASLTALTPAQTKAMHPQPQTLNPKLVGKNKTHADAIAFLTALNPYSNANPHPDPPPHQTAKETLNPRQVLEEQEGLDLETHADALAALTARALNDAAVSVREVCPVKLKARTHNQKPETWNPKPSPWVRDWSDC